MSEEEFEKYKSSLKIRYYEETVVNQEQRLKRYWPEIAMRRYEFDRRSAKSEALKSLIIMDIVEFFEVPRFKVKGELLEFNY